MTSCRRSARLLPGTGPSQPLFARFPELYQECFAWGLSHIGLRGAHVCRRAAEPGESRIIHPGKPGTESVEVDSGLASEGVHGFRAAFNNERVPGAAPFPPSIAPFKMGASMRRPEEFGRGAMSVCGAPLPPSAGVRGFAASS
jgi:hypothetical protein